MPPVSVRVDGGAGDTVIVYDAPAADVAILATLPGAELVGSGGIRVPVASLDFQRLSAACHDALTAAVAWRRSPARSFQARAHTIDVSRPIVMGVLNVTPDSFFDGGVAFNPTDPGVAVRAGVRLVEAGAAMVDVGGESTRPGAAPVAVDVEMARVLPVVEGLVQHGVCVSVDTRNAAVADACLHAGAAMINDVSAGLHDGQMFATVMRHGAGYVLMHMQGTPQTMQQKPSYQDVVADVFRFLAGRVAAFTASGGARTQLVVDPGIGFGKTVAHNVRLLTSLDELHALGCPVLIGVSQKSVLGAFTGHTDPKRRSAATIAAHALAVHAGAQIVRAHDVAATVDALAVADALRR